MNPGSHRAARAQAKKFAEPRVRGLLDNQKAGHIKRIQVMADQIWRRFNVGVYSWKLKHFHWFFDSYLADANEKKRAEFSWTIEKIVRVKGARHWIRPNPFKDGR